MGMRGETGSERLLMGVMLVGVIESVLTWGAERAGRALQQRRVIDSEAAAHHGLLVDLRCKAEARRKILPVFVNADHVVDSVLIRKDQLQRGEVEIRDAVAGFAERAEVVI